MESTEGQEDGGGDVDADVDVQEEAEEKEEQISPQRVQTLRNGAGCSMKTKMLRSPRCRQ